MNKRIQTGVLSALLAGGTILGATAVGGAVSAQVDDATTVDTATTVEVDDAQPNADESAPAGDENGHGHGRQHGVNGEALAELLGMDVEDLHTELRAGTTLADLAAANGVETSAVVDLIVEARTERIEQGVESGRLTADEAATRLEGLEERVTTRVEEGRPERPAGEGRRTRGHRGADAPADAPVDAEG